MAVDDSAITTSIDVGEFWKDKLKALAAHASQADAAMLLRMFSTDGSADGEPTSLMLSEEYVRIFPSDAPSVVETDFSAHHVQRTMGRPVESYSISPRASNASSHPCIGHQPHLR